MTRKGVLCLWIAFAIFATVACDTLTTDVLTTAEEVVDPLPIILDALDHIRDIVVPIGSYEVPIPIGQTYDRASLAAAHADYRASTEDGISEGDPLISMVLNLLDELYASDDLSVSAHGSTFVIESRDEDDEWAVRTVTVFSGLPQRAIAADRLITRYDDLGRETVREVSGVRIGFDGAGKIQIEAFKTEVEHDASTYGSFFYARFAEGQELFTISEREYDAHFVLVNRSYSAGTSVSLYTTSAASVGPEQYGYGSCNDAGWCSSAASVQGAYDTFSLSKSVGDVLLFRMFAMGISSAPSWMGTWNLHDTNSWDEFVLGTHERGTIRYQGVDLLYNVLFTDTGSLLYSYMGSPDAFTESVLDLSFMGLQFNGSTCSAVEFQAEIDEAGEHMAEGMTYDSIDFRTGNAFEQARVLLPAWAATLAQQAVRTEAD